MSASPSSVSPDDSRYERRGCVLPQYVSLKETSVNKKVSFGENDVAHARRYPRQMAKITTIHTSKTPIRIHYIPEWAELRGLKQADFVEKLDMSKGNVSKIFAGQLPEAHNIIKIATLLHLDEAASLFRHPNDDWLTRVLRGRTDEEKKRIIATIEAAFPRDGTHR